MKICLSSCVYSRERKIWHKRSGKEYLTMGTTQILSQPQLSDILDYIPQACLIAIIPIIILSLYLDTWQPEFFIFKCAWEHLNQRLKSNKMRKNNERSTFSRFVFEYLLFLVKKQNQIKSKQAREVLHMLRNLSVFSVWTVLYCSQRSWRLLLRGYT